MASRPSAPTSAPRRSGGPERRRLGLAVLMVVIGSFVPWLDTAVGELSGARGPGLWTFYAAMIGFAGVLLPMRRIAGIQAAIMAAACLALPVWQLTRAISLLGLSGGWLPGPGRVLVFGGGVLAGVAARGYLSAPQPRDG